jgi:putative zinc finger/helix-turn-helix YgiT family protein
MNTVKCPMGHGNMALGKVEKNTIFKGVDVSFEVEAYICNECSLEAGTVQSAGKVQRSIADAYRAKMDLLTSDEIKSIRKSRGFTQQQLAELMNIGIASLKRWETGMIQSKSMDYALRMQLQCDIKANNYSGNREFSIPRVKLVIKILEEKLGKRLLKITDRMLYAAKYLWYADMTAFRKLGRGMTGATYAALPLGPQLNNYSDLVAEIKKADEKPTEPLTEEEHKILDRIGKRFPEEQLVYDASHREKVWADTPIGALIPYSKANELTEI